VDVVEATTQPGGGSVMFSHYPNIIQYGKEHHLSLLTWWVFLSATHPDRFTVIRRYANNAARIAHQQSDVWRNFVFFLNNKLKILKKVDYNQYTEYEEFGWMCCECDCGHEQHAQVTPNSTPLCVGNSGDGGIGSDTIVADSTSPSTSIARVEGERVAHLLTVTAYPGKRMELLSRIKLLFESDVQRHAGVKTFKAFLSQVHPDQFLLFKRCGYDAKRGNQELAAEARDCFDRVANCDCDKTLLKHIEYRNFKEHHELGWTCRTHTMSQDDTVHPPISRTEWNV